RPAEQGTGRVLRQHHDDRPVARADGTGGVQHRAVEDADVSGDRARRRDRTGGTRVRRDVAEPVPALLRRPRPGERARDTERLVVPVGAARRRLVQVAHHEVAYRGGRRVEQVPVHPYHVGGAQAGGAPAGAVRGRRRRGVLEPQPTGHPHDDLVATVQVPEVAGRVVVAAAQHDGKARPVGGRDRVPGTAVPQVVQRDEQLHQRRRAEPCGGVLRDDEGTGLPVEHGDTGVDPGRYRCSGSPAPAPTRSAPADTAAASSSTAYRLTAAGTVYTSTNWYPMFLRINGHSGMVRSSPSYAATVPPTAATAASSAALAAGATSTTMSTPSGAPARTAATGSPS